jgi:AraC-like DNA-binding protein
VKAKPQRLIAVACLVQTFRIRCTIFSRDALAITIEAVRPFRAILEQRARMKQIPLLAAQIARPIVSYLDANGADSTAYLDRFRIPGEVIEAGGWIAKKQVYDMLHDVVQRERCPGIVFNAFSEFDFDDLGPITTAVRSSRTVKDALGAITSLAGLAYEGNEYFIRSDAETAWLCYRERDPASPASVAGQQATFAIYLKIIRLLSDPSWRPQQLQSQFRMDENFQAADGWEECQQIENGVYAAIAFPTSFLSRDLAWVKGPNATNDVDTQWRPDRAFDDEFVDSLHRLIASRFLFRTLPTLEQVAVITGLSTRTIKRHLSSNGLSYRRLLDRICFDEARSMLLDEGRTVKETALALGYPDTSKFVRSFRRMTGVTPGEYRRLAQ